MRWLVDLYIINSNIVNGTENGEVYINEDINAMPSMGISIIALYLNSWSLKLCMWNNIPNTNINVHKIIVLIKFAY